MKKSSIFKILTLFLTFVIFSCCSGCIFAIADYFNEKDLQKALEIQKEKKALADALVPEIEGYTFETRPESYFLGKEDWESQGFKIYSIFFASRDSFECRLERISENIEKYCVYRYQSNKIDLDQIGYVIPTEEQKAVFEIFPIFVTQSILYINEEFFLYSEMYSELYGWNAAGAIALFLLDFEKHKMYYVGYSKGWIEAELEDNQLYHWRRMCFKLTKNEGELI
ncbi:MAG: hypothetical protein E7339_07455 [Clostridiales bacterium]|nr:hypothetical protein [Clostridiales bacterium]